MRPHLVSDLLKITKLEDVRRLVRAEIEKEQQFIERLGRCPEGSTVRLAVASAESRITGHRQVLSWLADVTEV